MKSLPVYLVGLLSDNMTWFRQPVEQSIPSRERLMVCCPVAGAVRSVPCMVLFYTYPFYRFRFFPSTADSDGSIGASCSMVMYIE
jgi:hypothetical protein